MDTCTDSTQAGTRAACLQRLATALAGYGDLLVTVRAEGPAPRLAARNTVIPDLSETIAVTRFGDGLAYVWSWGECIADASDPDTAAQAIAYVLSARDVHLDQRRQEGPDAIGKHEGKPKPPPKPIKPPPKPSPDERKGGGGKRERPKKK